MNIITQLPAVTVDGQVVVCEGQVDEAVDDAVGGSTGGLPRTVGIRHPGDGKAQAKQAPIEPQVLLHGALVNRVHAERIAEGGLSHGNRHRPAVLQTRARGDDFRRRIGVADGVEQHQRAAAVHIEVGPGVVHAAHGARLSRQVEHELLSGHKPRHQGVVAQVSFNHPDAVIFERAHLPSMPFARRCEHDHASAQSHKARGQVQPDEPEATHHQHGSVARHDHREDPNPKRLSAATNSTSLYRAA